MFLLFIFCKGIVFCALFLKIDLKNTWIFHASHLLLVCHLYSSLHFILFLKHYWVLYLLDSGNLLLLLFYRACIFYPGKFEIYFSLFSVSLPLVIYFLQLVQWLDSINVFTPPHFLFLLLPTTPTLNLIFVLAASLGCLYEEHNEVDKSQQTVDEDPA